MGKTLVEYFSASGVTAKLARNMQVLAKGAKVVSGKRFGSNQEDLYDEKGMGNGQRTVFGSQTGCPVS